MAAIIEISTSPVVPLRTPSSSGRQSSCDRTALSMRTALVALLVLGLLGALRIAAGAEASAVGDAHPLGESFHVVGPGDTLWSIAAEVDSSASRPEIVQQLVSLNGGDGSVDLGEVVVLPDPSS